MNARNLALLLLATTAMFEQGIVAMQAMVPPVQPVVFSMAWLAEAAICWLLFLALDRQCTP